MLKNKNPEDKLVFMLLRLLSSMFWFQSFFWLSCLKTFTDNIFSIGTVESVLVIIIIPARDCFSICVYMLFIIGNEPDKYNYGLSAMADN